MTRPVSKPATPGLGERLRRLRKAKGFSEQSDLAKKSGVGKNIICQIESGLIPNPHVDKIAKLSNTLGVPMDYLVYGSAVEDIIDRYIESDFAKTLDPPLSNEEIFRLKTDVWRLDEGQILDLRTIDCHVRNIRTLDKRLKIGRS